MDILNVPKAKLLLIMKFALYIIFKYFIYFLILLYFYFSPAKKGFSFILIIIVHPLLETALSNNPFSQSTFKNKQKVSKFPKKQQNKSVFLRFFWPILCRFDSVCLLFSRSFSVLDVLLIV